MGSFCFSAPPWRQLATADVLIKGTATDPKVSVSFKYFVVKSEYNVKDKAKEELNEERSWSQSQTITCQKRKRRTRKVKAEADKLIKDAEANRLRKTSSKRKKYALKERRWQKK